jgi:hypothetical protein
MIRKPIKIDWEALEDAFTNPEEDFECYLDRVTGRVVLEGEGEGEGDGFDEDEAAFDRNPVAAPPPPRNDSTRLYVHPPTVEQKVEWMEAFLAENSRPVEGQAAAFDELRDALGTDDAPAALSDVLNRNPEVRDGWYLYRTMRLREMIEGWLAANDVALADPPPWR